jgi:ribonuclease D
MDQKTPHYVDTSTKLESLVAELRPHKIIGIDTEFISEGRYEPALCLVQVAIPGEIWLVDPLGVPDLKKLWRLFAEDGRVMVTVAARQEIKFAAAGAGEPPSCVLDLQIAAGLVGFGFPLSHTNLVLRLLGTKIHGGESFTDWRKRPLAAVQLKYAADDVRYLLAMREKLLESAQKMNRTAWIEGECAQLVRTVVREEERWRVSGSARLSRRQLAALRGVWRWRDRSARELNMPATRVLGDSMLVEIARRLPPTAEDLFALRGLDRKLLRQGVDEIISAVGAALKMPEAELPSNERREDPSQVAVLAKLLSVAANGLAAEYRIDPALLATTADLQELVRWRIAPDENERPALLEGWRGEILGKPLLSILDGESCVRVQSVSRPNPLVFEAINQGKK